MTEATSDQPIHGRPSGNGRAVGREAPAMPLRAAMIGSGKIAEQHLRSIAAMDHTSVAGLCDLSPALARFTAERFAVEQWFTDYRRMLDAVSPDVVHILTPAATHERFIHDCIERGHDVIVEKPIALSNSRFRVLWELATKRGVRLVENHNYRFNQPIRQIEQALAEGLIGEVSEVEVRMALNVRWAGRYADTNLPHPSHQLPAGVIHEFITHLCYLLLRFLPDQRIDAAHAAWRNRGGGELFKYDELDATVEVASATGRIRFTARQWPDNFTVHVRGTKGHATAELFQPSFQLTRYRPIGQHLNPPVNAVAAAGSMLHAGVGSIWRKIRNRTPYEGLDRFLASTYHAFQNASEPPVTFTDMDRTTRLIDTLLAPENQA